jgi:hypothetical protein
MSFRAGPGALLGTGISVSVTSRFVELGRLTSGRYQNRTGGWTVCSAVPYVHSVVAGGALIIM